MHPRTGRTVSRTRGRVALCVLLACLLLTGIAAAGENGAAPPDEADLPSYFLPNIIAAGMSLTVLAIACKRYQKA